MFTPLYIWFDKQYGPYSHSGCWTLINSQIKLLLKFENVLQMPKPAEAKTEVVITSKRNNYFNQF